MAAALARGVTSQTSPPVAGLMPEQWIGLWRLCHNPTPAGFLQWCWPDGRATLRQPVMLAQAFQLIGAAFLEAAISELEKTRGR